MFNRYLTSVMIVTSAFTLVIGQTPEPKEERALAPLAFAFSFDGDGGYLGVSTQEVSKENFAKFGLREVRGVAVEKVLENSPAATAGIQSGDVIVRLDGDEIGSTRKLTRLISEIDPDHKVRVTVFRGGSEQEITATLGKRPGAVFDNGNFNYPTPGPMGSLSPDHFKAFPQMGALPQIEDFPKGEFMTIPHGDGQGFAWQAGSSRQIGIAVYAITKQLGELFGVDGGVMVNEVRDESPAAKAGLKAGDIIVEVDGKVVKNDFDLIRSINTKKDGSINLTFLRDRKRQTISVTPEASKGSGFLFRTDSDDGLIPLKPASAPIQPHQIKPLQRMTAPAPARNLSRPSRGI